MRTERRSSRVQSVSNVVETLIQALDAEEALQLGPRQFGACLSYHHLRSSTLLANVHPHPQTLACRKFNHVASLVQWSQVDSDHESCLIGTSEIELYHCTLLLVWPLESGVPSASIIYESPSPSLSLLPCPPIPLVHLDSPAPLPSSHPLLSHPISSHLHPTHQSVTRQTATRIPIAASCHSFILEKPWVPSVLASPALSSLTQPGPIIPPASYHAPNLVPSLVCD